MSATRARAARTSDGLSESDRGAIRAWLWSRAATAVVVTVAGTLFGSGDVAPGWVDRWRQWDVVHYQAIAAGGYQQGGPTPYAAFFPGLPLVLRLLSEVGIGLTAAGLLVSLVAGAAAVVALGRLASLDGPGAAGERAVLLLVLSPAAVFLAAGYTEALFLGLSLPAWLAARRGRWWTAGLLAAGASSVRVTGIFLAVALVVEWVAGGGTVRRTDGAAGRRPDGLVALSLPFLPPLAFSAYLKATQSDWLAWVDAQKLGWGRSFTDPLSAWNRTVDAAFGSSQPLGFRVMFQAEIVALLVGVALTVWLLWRRRWGESVYVGLQVTALGTSTFYFSVPRATLLWWPLWILLARASLRRPWVLTAYLAVVAPLSVLWAAAFVTGRWAG